MGATVAIVALQFLITLLFLPLSIGAKGHASLAYDRLQIDVTVFGIALARVRVKRENGRYAAYVNGNRVRGKMKGGAKRMASAIRQVKIEKPRISGSVLALVGTREAKDCAMLSALARAVAPMIGALEIYAVDSSSVLELDGRIKVKITILQLVAILVRGLGW